MTVLLWRHSCASERNDIESKKSGPTGRFFDSISFDARWAAGNEEFLAYVVCCQLFSFSLLRRRFQRSPERTWQTFFSDSIFICKLFMRMCNQQHCVRSFFTQFVLLYLGLVAFGMHEPVETDLRSCFPKLWAGT